MATYRVIRLFSDNNNSSRGPIIAGATGLGAAGLGLGYKYIQAGDDLKKSKELTDNLEILNHRRVESTDANRRFEEAAVDRAKAKNKLYRAEDLLMDAEDKLDDLSKKDPSSREYFRAKDEYRDAKLSKDIASKSARDAEKTMKDSKNLSERARNRYKDANKFYEDSYRAASKDAKHFHDKGITKKSSALWHKLKSPTGAAIGAAGLIGAGSLGYGLYKKSN